MKTKTRRYGLLGIAALLIFAATLGAYLTDAALYSPPNYNTFMPPAVGGTYVDPVFGTTVQRLSNAPAMGAQFIETEYATTSPFSIDNSWIILLHFGQFGLYTGQGNFVRMVTNEVCATCEPRWSRTDPNVFYYHTGNNLKSYNASSGATAVVHNFSEYSSIDGKGEMELSFDGDHLVFARSPFLTGELAHWHFDTFALHWRNAWLGQTLVTFRLAADGTVEGVEWEGVELRRK